MRIIVLGGAGNMGSAVVRSLAEGGGLEVVVADCRLDAARSVAQSIGGVSTVEVDVTRRESLEAAIGPSDIVVNCIGPFYRHAPAVCLAALQRGAHYVDICDDDDPTEAMLSYDPIARAKGLVALVGIGWTPGITNVCARRAADRLDEVERIDVVWVGSATDTTGQPGSGVGVIQHVFHAINRPVPMFLDRRWVRVDPLSEELLEVEVPEPFGRVKAYYCGHPEPVTLPRFLPEVREVTVRGAIMPPAVDELFAFLVRMGFAETEERIDQAPGFLLQLTPALAAVGMLNAPPTSAAVVEVRGSKGGSPRTFRYACVDRMHRLTGIPCAIAVRMLAQGRVQGAGVLAPEAALPAEEFLSELERAGIKVTEEVA